MSSLDTRFKRGLRSQIHTWRSLHSRTAKTTTSPTHRSRPGSNAEEGCSSYPSKAQFYSL